MSKWNNAASFLRESRRNFRDVGSILPSSRYLGRALASNLEGRNSPARILEAGPGTGPVTSQILPRLLPGDQLDLVELNEQFVAHLKQRLENDPEFVPYKNQVRVHCGPIEQVPGDGVYDFIISGLPLNNFPPELVRRIMRAFQRLLKPGGVLSYFEYACLRQLKLRLGARKERRRLARVARVVSTHIRKSQIRQQHVLLNVPPALVHHLRFRTAEPG
jgi:phospholipid N-methyltransferase